MVYVAWGSYDFKNCLLQRTFAAAVSGDQIEDWRLKNVMYVTTLSGMTLDSHQREKSVITRLLDANEGWRMKLQCIRESLISGFGDY